MIVSELGQLQVNIEPPAAAAAGAMWRLQGESEENWSASGTVRDDVPVGMRTVEFKDAATWVTPMNETVLVTTDSLALTTGTYLRVTYTLNYLADPNGFIQGEASQTVEHGGAGTSVLAVGNEGYHFTAWSDSRTDNPRTDTNVTSNVTVTASFAINLYTLTYIAGDNGTIDGVTSRTFVVSHGDTGSTVTAIPTPGYWFIRWTDDSTMNPRVDANVTSPVLVTAIFAMPDSGISAAQVCLVESDNRVFAALYNFAQGGGWAAWLDEEGGGSLPYNLPFEEWLGFYLYDYASATWTHGLYVFKN